MFTNDQRQVERTGKYGTPRAEYLQELVTEFQTTTNEESKEKVVAHLANFAYDPYNYNFLRQRKMKGSSNLVWVGYVTHVLVNSATPLFACNEIASKLPLGWSNGRTANGSIGDALKTDSFLFTNCIICSTLCFLLPESFINFISFFFSDFLRYFLCTADPANASVIVQCGGIPLVIQCLSSPVRNTVNYALGALYYLCNSQTKEEILKPEVVEVIRKYAAAEAVSVGFSNLANAFLLKHVKQ